MENVLNSCTRNYATKKQSKIWQQKPNREPRLKIILAEDVHNLGVKGQIVKVKHGYGRNDLLPSKRAVYVTPRNIEKFSAFEVDQKAPTSAKFTNDKIVDYLSKKTLVVQHDPYDMSAIFEQHIAKAFQHSLYLLVPLECIELEEPITDFESEHSVDVRVDEDTVVKVPLVIERTLSKKKERRIGQMERFRKKMESRMET